MQKTEELTKTKKYIYDFLLKLPSKRRIFYQIGPLWVEVRREEALKLIEKESSFVEKNDSQKEVKR